MNPAKRVEKLRTEYERALAASEARGSAYHQAVRGLLEGGGVEVRMLAAELGLLDTPALTPQPGEQILVANSQRLSRRRSHARAAGALVLVLVLAVLTVGVLRAAQLPPFVPFVQVPRVVGLQETVAIRRLDDAGLNVRLIRYWRSIPGLSPHSVVGVSHPAGAPAAGERMAKGSTITLYVVMGNRSAKNRKTHS